MTKGVFRRRESPTPDPNLKIINVEHDKRKTKHYRMVMAMLLQLITQHITPYVNYAHMQVPSIPKTNLPLKFEGNHMDIAFLLPDGALAFIQLHVLDPEKVAKKWRGAKWQKQK